eukprot:CAMPEP_0168860124 /NCGR_PEP_ID=MMETSP0727-20121128/17203_1 /TAXON_ID=265536 /ORGANISM="Amphiprora sp., Strain CCMP467" /LENGTH=92 /DNA_ID=CAMNT_0008915013 /DNA_START=24 /DNA_END=303 /DNA_ORIENTATION=-
MGVDGGSDGGGSLDDDDFEEKSSIGQASPARGVVLRAAASKNPNNPATAAVAANKAAPWQAMYCKGAVSISNQRSKMQRQLEESSFSFPGPK